MTACCRRFIHPTKQTTTNDSGFIARIVLCRPRTTSFALELMTSAPLARTTLSIVSVRRLFEHYGNDNAHRLLAADAAEEFQDASGDRARNQIFGEILEEC